MGSFNLPTTPQRSRIMSAIRGRDNVSTERRLMRILRSHQISGWRRHMKLPGSPDFAFPSAHVAVFVHGCFWHGCPRCYKEPRSNVEYWREKIVRNKKRDAKVARQLRLRGWSVLTFWEHSLGNAGAVSARIQRTLANRSN
ncbi:DNA mismatch endonuclease Vsr [Burkholderia cepacia]|uniref:very short patch repair endonuclease n=1 Tax=Burkholderia cepacia TaxID=292 RepID=UPI000F5F9792|nr:DNA mismatch endonuclease Vsr [Burkholderia cepacia]